MKVETTVSPAPVTSKTSVETGLPAFLEERHPFLSLREEEGTGAEPLAQCLTCFEKRLRIGDPSSEGRRGLCEIRCENRSTLVAEEVGLLRIDTNGDRSFARLLEKPAQEILNDHPFAVVGDHDRRDILKDLHRRIADLHENVAVDLAGILAIDPDDLLVAGNQAGLRGRSPQRIGEKQIGSDAVCADRLAQLLAVWVIPHHADKPRATTEGVDVARDIRRPSEAKGLLARLNDGDRRLGGDPHGVPPQVAVEHHIAQDKDG